MYFLYKIQNQNIIQKLHTRYTNTVEEINHLYDLNEIFKDLLDFATLV